MLVVGNSSEPWLACKKDERPFMSLWDKIVHTPLPDYASRRVRGRCWCWCWSCCCCCWRCLRQCATYRIILLGDRAVLVWHCVCVLCCNMALVCLIAHLLLLQCRQ